MTGITGTSSLNQPPPLSSKTPPQNSPASKPPHQSDTLEPRTPRARSKSFSFSLRSPRKKNASKLPKSNSAPLPHSGKSTQSLSYSKLEAITTNLIRITGNGEVEVDKALYDEIKKIPFNQIQQHKLLKELWNSHLKNKYPDLIASWNAWCSTDTDKIFKQLVERDIKYWLPSTVRTKDSAKAQKVFDQEKQFVQKHSLMNSSYRAAFAEYKFETLYLLLFRKKRPVSGKS